MPDDPAKGKSWTDVGGHLRTILDKHAVFVVLAIFVAGFASSVAVTQFIRTITEERKVSPHEDITALAQISGILQENQATNALYSDFENTADMHTPIADYFRTFDTLLSTKESLVRRLSDVRVTPRFARLQEILSESIRSDAKLIALEKERIQSLLDYMKIMNAVPARTPDPSLSAEDQRSAALEVLRQFRERNKQWLEKAKKNEVALKSTRGVPYHFDNPYQEQPRPVPTAPPGPLR
jgi:hypothetical protein